MKISLNISDGGEGRNLLRPLLNSRCQFHKAKIVATNLLEQIIREWNHRHALRQRDKMRVPKLGRVFAECLRLSDECFEKITHTRHLTFIQRLPDR